MKRLAAILVALLAPVPSGAITVEDLHGQCAEVIRMDAGATDADYIAAAACMGYIHGVTETVAVWQGLTTDGPRICMPTQGISNEQAIRMFMKAAEANPEEWHENARVHVLISLMEAFRCPAAQ